MHRLLAVGLFLLTLARSAAGTFDLSTATYLGTAADAEAVRGIRLASDGTVVIAANIGTHPLFTTTTQFLLGGATAASPGSLLRLTADGRTLLSWTRLATEVTDLSIDAADRLYISCGIQGAAVLSADGGTELQRITPPGRVQRIDAGAGGAFVFLEMGTSGNPETNPGPGTIHHYGANGTLTASFPGRSNTLDLCWDEASQTVCYIGWKQANAFGPPNDGTTSNFFPVQISYARGVSPTGTPKWLAYDWSANTGHDAATDSFVPGANSPLYPGISQTKVDPRFLNRLTNNMADTRGLRCAMGADGKLYLAFECAGGNHIFRSGPYELATAGSIVGGDQWHQFVNTGAAHKTYVGRHDPATGDVLLGQQFNSLLQTSNGPAANAYRMEGTDLCADEDGNLYLGGTSAFGLPFPQHPLYRSSVQPAFNPFPPLAYLGGAPFIAMNATMATRRYVTRLAIDGSTRAVAARKFPGEATARIAFGGEANLASGPIYTHEALQPLAGYGVKDGFLAVLGGTPITGGPDANRYTFTFGDTAYTGGLALSPGPVLQTPTVDHDGDGLDDSRQLQTFSQPNNYTGPPWRGFLLNRTKDASTLSFSESTIKDSKLSIRIQPGASLACMQYGMLYFPRESFAALSPSATLTFDRFSQLSTDAAMGRWLVQDGSAWYVSEQRITSTAKTMLFENDGDHGRWAVLPRFRNAQAIETPFRADEACFATHRFTDVRAVGLLLDVPTFSNARFWLQMNSFQAHFSTGTPIPPPRAQFTAAKAAQSPSVGFDGTNSAAQGGTPGFYAWDFGDGEQSSGPVTSHTYTAGGPYDATLRVWDATLQSTTSTRRIEISLPPAAPQDTVVSFGGAVGSQRFAREASSTGLDFDGDGPDDTARRSPFSETAALLTPPRGTRWHGGVETRSYGPTASWAASGTKATAMEFRVQPDSTGPTDLHAAWYVDRSQFLNGGSARAVSLALGDSLQLSGITNWERAGEVRWLVREGTSFYVSATTITPATGVATLTITAGQTWAPYSPQTSLDFAAATAVFSPRTFSAVTGLGLVMDGDAAETGRRWIAFSKFDVKATVASPATSSPTLQISPSWPASTPGVLTVPVGQRISLSAVGGSLAYSTSTWSWVTATDTLFGPSICQTFAEPARLHTFTVTLTDTVGNEAILSQSLLTEASTYAEFLARSALPPGDSAPTADPDGDGLPNLWEYVLAQSPLQPDATEDYFRIAATSKANERRLSLKQNKRTYGYKPRCWLSADLLTWWPIDTEPTTVEDTGTDVWHHWDLTSSSVRLFTRFSLEATTVTPP